MTREPDNTTRSNDAEPSARSRAMGELADLLSCLPLTMLIALKPLLAEIVRVADSCPSRKAMHRFSRRLFSIARYRELMRMPECWKLSQWGVIRRLQAECSRLFDGWKCSQRQLQAYIAAWNEQSYDGMASAWTGVRNPATRLDVGGRSPEAVRFFRYHYRKGRSIAECHRRTLDEAGKRGWRWPRTAAATRYFLRRFDVLAGVNDTQSKGVRPTVDHDSTACQDR